MSEETVTLVVGNVPKSVVCKMLEVAQWHHMTPDAWLRAVMESALYRHKGVLSPREARRYGGRFLPFMRLED